MIHRGRIALNLMRDLYFKCARQKLHISGCQSHQHVNNVNRMALFAELFGYLPLRTDCYVGVKAQDSSPENVQYNTIQYNCVVSM